MAAMTLPAVSSEAGISRYFREIWTYPILTDREEFELATTFRDTGDLEAAHRLVTSHLRLVAKIAMGYRGYGVPVSDLIAEGNIGLMKAVKKFEPERGFRLATYAMWWIRAAITEYILRTWSLVKMGTLAAQKKLFFSLRRIKRQLEIVDSGELTPEQAAQLAEHLDVSQTDVVEMNRRLAVRDLSLNAPMSRDNDESAEFQDTLIDEAPSPEVLVADREEGRHRHQALYAALDGLPERERHIIAERWLREDPRTLEDLGKEFGISRERVRQLEARALEKVRKVMTLPAIPAVAAAT